MPSDINTDSPQQNKTSWRALKLFNFYRLVLTGLIISLDIADYLPQPFGKTDPESFRQTMYVYFFCAIIFAFSIPFKKPGYLVQAYTQVLCDIIALTFMFHTSGPDSGLGLLLIVAIAGGSLLVPGITAYFFAAIASLSLLFEQFYSQIYHVYDATYYSRTGMLGIVFFATAILSHALASRIIKSEALAAQRGLDLANLAELNEHIIQRMQSGILVVDNKNRIRLANVSAYRLLGVSHIKENQSLEEIAPRISSQLVEWRSNPDSENRIIKSTSNSFSLIPRFARLGSLSDQGTLVFLEDAASMKQQAHQLKLASLGRLTASIAHEIRNPLSAISHAGQLLEESPEIPDKDKRLTEIIRNHARRMNTIIENILQLSRQDKAHPELINLKPWLEEFVSEFVLTTNITDHEIKIISGDDNIQVRFDADHLRQILWNLCKNGLRHSHGYKKNPKIELNVYMNTETERPILDVQDHGPGIDPAEVNKIFEPFYTTESSGTGLGLYIARELCETNQSSLELTQQKGKGACFRIIFADPRRKQL